MGGERTQKSGHDLRAFVGTMSGDEWSEGRTLEFHGLAAGDVGTWVCLRRSRDCGPRAQVRGYRDRGLSLCL